MKQCQIVASFLIFMLLAQTGHGERVCPETEYDKGFKSDLPTIDGPEIIHANGALFPNGRLKCLVQFNYETLKDNIRIRIEEGTYDGIKYRLYFSDGSGSVQGLATNTLDYIKDEYGANWSIQCHVDEMDDTHWCSLNRGDMIVGIWKDGTPFVNIGSDHYPGSEIAIRIDKNKPISTSEESGFTEAQTEEIIEQLMQGATVLIRYQEWPYQRNKDNSFKLFGFPQAWAILREIYKAVNSH